MLRFIYVQNVKINIASLVYLSMPKQNKETELIKDALVGRY